VSFARSLEASCANSRASMPTGQAISLTSRSFHRHTPSAETVAPSSSVAKSAKASSHSCV
jgi:hypothetical protein